MKTKFDEQLEEMHVELIEMGSLCEQAITLSSRALLRDRRKPGGTGVFCGRARSTSRSVRLKISACACFFCSSPFASDLRKISAALKMISDMERIGDQASDIADMVP